MVAPDSGEEPGTGTLTGVSTPLALAKLESLISHHPTLPFFSGVLGESKTPTVIF